MSRRTSWIMVVLAVSAGWRPGTARAQGLFGWLRGDSNQGIVNVYVPPAPIATGTVPAPPTTSPVVVSRPVVTTYANPPVVTYANPPAATTVPAPPPPTTAAPPAPARGYTVQYRARTRYRSTWVQVPVTVYRPTTVVDPLTGAVRTTNNACTTYTWQLRRVPVVQYRPIRVFPGPPPAQSGVPTVTAASPVLPAVPAATPVPSPTLATPWRPVPSVTMPATGTATWGVPPVSAPAVVAAPATTTPATPPSATSSSPPAPSSTPRDSADIKPRLDPSELQRLETQTPPPVRTQKPSSEEKRSTGNAKEPTSSDEMRLDQPANGRPANQSTGYHGRRRAVPIPRIRFPETDKTRSAAPETTPAAPSTPRSPAEVDDPPQLLDPNDRLALD